MEFNITRFSSLIRRDFALNGKTYLLGTLGALIVLGVFMIMYASSNSNNNPDRPLVANGFYPFYFILFGLGWLMVSLNFREHTSHFGRINYFGLPASNFEKYLSHWLYTFVGIPAGLLLVYWIGYHLFSGVTTILYNVEYPDFRLFVNQEEYQILWRVWILGHSFIFLCSVIYDRITPIMTLLTAIGVALIIAFVGVLIFRITFYEFFDGFGLSIQNDEFQMRPSRAFVDFMEYRLWPIAKPLLFFALPIYLWIVAYFRFTEKEA